MRELEARCSSGSDRSLAPDQPLQPCLVADDQSGALQVCQFLVAELAQEPAALWQLPHYGSLPPLLVEGLALVSSLSEVVLAENESLGISFNTKFLPWSSMLSREFFAIPLRLPGEGEEADYRYVGRCGLAVFQTRTKPSKETVFCTFVGSHGDGGAIVSLGLSVGDRFTVTTPTWFLGPAEDL